MQPTRKFKMLADFANPAFFSCFGVSFRKTFPTVHGNAAQNSGAARQRGSNSQHSHQELQMH